MKKVILAGTVFFTVFILSGCTKDVANPGIPVSKDQAGLTSGDGMESQLEAETQNIEKVNMLTADWETYANEKHGYSIKHPKEWFFLKDACCPPPPTFVSFNNISDTKNVFTARQLEKNVYNFDILCGYEGAIDDIGEVKLMKEEGETNEATTINSLDAIKFTKNRYPDDPSEKVFSYYIVDGAKGCRVGFDSKCPTCETVVSTFKFNK